MTLPANDPARRQSSPIGCVVGTWRCPRCGVVHSLIYKHKWVYIKGYRRRVCAVDCRKT